MQATARVGSVVSSTVASAPRRCPSDCLRQAMPLRFIPDRRCLIRSVRPTDSVHRHMKNLIAILIGLTAIVVLLWSSELFMGTSNCGGNSAALSQVHGIACFARAHAFYRPDSTFRFTHLSTDERSELANYSVQRWIKRARFLVTTMPIHRSESSRTIVAVCDTPFTNVPQQLIGRAPATHAVGYSDGSTGLITEAEFRKLDPTKFTDVASLVRPPTN